MSSTRQFRQSLSSTVPSRSARSRLRSSRWGPSQRLWKVSGRAEFVLRVRPSCWVVRTTSRLLPRRKSGTRSALSLRKENDIPRGGRKVREMCSKTGPGNNIREQQSGRFLAAQLPLLNIKLRVPDTRMRL